MHIFFTVTIILTLFNTHEGVQASRILRLLRNNGPKSRPARQGVPPKSVKERTRIRIHAPIYRSPKNSAESCLDTSRDKMNPGYQELSDEAKAEEKRKQENLSRFNETQDQRRMITRNLHRLQPHSRFELAREQRQAELRERQRKLKRFQRAKEQEKLDRQAIKNYDRKFLNPLDNLPEVRKVKMLRKIRSDPDSKRLIPYIHEYYQEREKRNRQNVRNWDFELKERYPSKSVSERRQEMIEIMNDIKVPLLLWYADRYYAPLLKKPASKGKVLMDLLDSISE